MVLAIIFGVVYLALFVAASIALRFRLDVRRQMLRATPERLAPVIVSGGVPVVASVPWDASIRLACEAIRACGGRDVREIGGCVVTGWVGNPLSAPAGNVGRISQRQALIGLWLQPDGMVEFVCNARPRWGWRVGDSGHSRMLAEQLAREVSVLVGAGGKPEG